MQILLQDLRYSLRQLIRSLGFTLTAVISLALGIGATSAVFSVIYAALVNPFPYPSAGRIVRPILASKSSPEYMPVLTGPQIRQVRQNAAVEDVLAMDYQSLTLSSKGLQQSLRAISLISTGFQDLGVPPALGRGILPSDSVDGQDPEPVVVLSYKSWEKYFSKRPDVLGQVVQLDHKNYAIVGVAGARFNWYSGDIYLPLKIDQSQVHEYAADLLLRRGVTREMAGASLQQDFEQFGRDMPNHFPEKFTVRFQGLNDWVVNSISGTLYLLFGAVSLLLAIGCGNVSILLLARGTSRQHELAVRSAIGAQRLRIARQLLTEALLLASIGAALGVLTSYLMLLFIKVLLPRWAFAPEVSIRINPAVLLFGVAVALATGVLFGMWPAWRFSRAQPGHAMQLNTRVVKGSVGGRRSYDLLVAGQIGLTLMLLAFAGFAMEGFVKLMHMPLGYDPHNILAVGLTLHDGTYTSWAGRGAYFEQLRAKIAAVPGVSMAAISTSATPPQNVWNGRFEILGKPPAEEQLALIELVSPEFFATLRIPMLQGRIWNAAENRQGAHVAVINRTMAKRYFPNGDAIGHSIKFPTIENRPPASFTVENAAQSWLQIIGIVEDNLNSGLRKPVRPAAFIPYTIWLVNFTEILARTEMPPLSLQHAVSDQVNSVSDAQPAEMDDMETWIPQFPEWGQEHLTAWIFGIFASLALVLAAVGLYSVVSYTVAQRTNEFGIRVALGAPRGHLLRLLLSSTAMSVAGGIVAGLALTVATHSFLGKWTEGNSRDPVVLLAGITLLVLVAGAACAIPAWQASRTDPIAALRAE
jgi:predicted permease